MPRTRARRDGLNDRCRGRWAGRNGVNAETQRAQSCHSTPLYFVEFVHGVEATVLRKISPIEFTLSLRPLRLCVSIFPYSCLPESTAPSFAPIHDLFEQVDRQRNGVNAEAQRAQSCHSTPLCFLLNLFTGLRRQFSEDLSRRIHPVSASSAPLRFNLSLLVSARKYRPFIAPIAPHDLFEQVNRQRNGVNAEAQRAQSCHSTPQFFVKFVHGVEATVLRRSLPSNSPSLCVLCASAFQSFPTRVCQKVPPVHSPRTIFSSKWTDKEMGLTQRRRGRRVVTRHRNFFVEFVYRVEATVLRRFLPSNSPCLCVLCASAFQSFPTRVRQKVPPLHSPRYDAHVFGVSNTRTSSSLSSASCNGVCSQLQIAMAMFSTVGFTSRKYSMSSFKCL